MVFGPADGAQDRGLDSRPMVFGPADGIRGHGPDSRPMVFGPADGSRGQGPECSPSPSGGGGTSVPASRASLHRFRAKGGCSRPSSPGAFQAPSGTKNALGTTDSGLGRRFSDRRTDLGTTDSGATRRSSDRRGEPGAACSGFTRAPSGAREELGLACSGPTEPPACGRDRRTSGPRTREPNDDLRIGGRCSWPLGSGATRPSLAEGKISGPSGPGVCPRSSDRGRVLGTTGQVGSALDSPSGPAGRRSVSMPRAARARTTHGRLLFGGPVEAESTLRGGHRADGPLVPRCRHLLREAGARRVRLLCRTGDGLFGARRRTATGQRVFWCSTRPSGRDEPLEGPSVPRSSFPASSWGRRQAGGSTGPEGSRRSSER
jgi:hypothetical protein